MILVASIAYNSSWAVKEQARLFRKNLGDSHALLVFDNSSDEAQREAIAGLCAEMHTIYVRVPGPAHFGRSDEHRLHADALNFAAGEFRLLDAVGTCHGFSASEVTHQLWVDHDVFPSGPVTLGPLIDQAGFLAIGQRHPATGRRYPFPGFLAVSRRWLAGRPMNFTGIRGAEKRDDGDTGSMLWPLFASDDEWARQPLIEHGYQEIRPADEVGLQSWGYEYWSFGGASRFVHLTNLSRWLAVPEPDEREALLREMVEAL